MSSLPTPPEQAIASCLKARPLGSSSLTLSPVAFGCMSLVEGDTYGGLERTQAVATVRAAVDAGITCFDTAPMYGQGAADDVLGEALQNGRRESVVIATKLPPDQLGAEQVSKSCEASLRRLRTDRIDLLQIHWPNPAIPIAETWSALKALQDRGLVREIGVCNFGPQQLSELLPLGGCRSNQVAYSLLMRAPEFYVRRLCSEHGMSLLCYSPLAQGLLTGRYRSADDVPPTRARTRHFRGDRPKARHKGPGCEDLTFETIGRLVRACDAAGIALADAAIAWLLQQPAVAGVLIGASRPEQVQRNIRAANLALPPELSAELTRATESLKYTLGSALDLWAPESRSR